MKRTRSNADDQNYSDDDDAPSNMSSIADSDMSSSNVKREPDDDGEWDVFVWAEFLFHKYQIDANNTSRRPIDISMMIGSVYTTSY